MTNITLNQIHSANFSSFNSGDFTRIRGLASSRNGAIIYTALLGNGIMKSTDYGVTWSSANPDGNSSWGMTSVACSSDGTIVYAVPLGSGLYKSTDSGSTWSLVTAGQPLPVGSGNPEVNVGYDTYNIYQVACDSTGTKLIMTTNFAAVIYRSINSGVTWTNQYTIPNYPQNPNSPTVLASNIDGNVLFAAFNNTDQNIYKSTDLGVTWNQIASQGLATGPFSNLFSNLTGDFCYACNQAGLNIFYDTHAVNAILVPTGGSLITTVASYNNGQNVVVSVNNATQTYSVNNLFPPGQIPGEITPCFNEDTKILCYKNGEEIYVPIQDIRKGDLIVTHIDGYKPVHMIGTSKLYNPGNKLRGKNRLYVCKPDNYPELNEDLILTGCHSILVNDLSEEQKEKSIAYIGKIYITDNKYRLIACLDPLAEPYEKEGVFNIWHLALEHENYYWNYGIFANGLLVESCSQRFLKELSGMTLIE